MSVARKDDEGRARDPLRCVPAVRQGHEAVQLSVQHLHRNRDAARSEVPTATLEVEILRVAEHALAKRLSHCRRERVLRLGVGEDRGVGLRQVERLVMGLSFGDCAFRALLGRPPAGSRPVGDPVDRRSGRAGL